MIVRAAGDRLQLITQPDHAKLAGSIMERCVPLARHQRREPILHAIREHDNGWNEVDARPLFDPQTGGIFDFITAPVEVRQGVWPRAVSRLADDPWAAALVAQHALTIYDRYLADPSWTAFFAGMTRLRDAMLHALGMPPEPLSADYPFVRLGDLISLTFCTGWTAPQRFGEWTVECRDGHVTVAPSAFGGTSIPIEIQAREIAAGPYQSDGDLQAAWREASLETTSGVVLRKT